MVGGEPGDGGIKDRAPCAGAGGALVRSGVVTRVTSDTVLLREAASESLIGLINGTVMLVGSLVLMGVLDPVLLATTVAAVAPPCRAVAEQAGLRAHKGTSVPYVKPPRTLPRQ